VPLPTSGAPESFQTARLRADRLCPDDLAELRRMHRDEAVMAHLGGVRDEPATLAYLRLNLRHWDEHGFGLYIVRERDGVEPVGRGLLRTLRVDEVDEIEVGYAFYAPFWGRGYATEITAGCMDVARRYLSRDTFVALTSEQNLASQRVLTKCGFAYAQRLMHAGAEHLLFRRA
jgi:[ribosomal protein S5]-alanine N-acetyltransferase